MHSAFGTPQAISVVIIESAPLVLIGLQHLLDTQIDISVVGTAGLASIGKRMVVIHRPTVIVIGTALSDGSGFTLCRELRTAWSAGRVVLVGGHGQPAALAEAIRVGASGLFPAYRQPEELPSTLRQAANDIWSYTMPQRQQVDEWEYSIGAQLRSLTPRERQVMQLVGLGHDNQAVATSLHIRENTVVNHMTAVLGKLQLTSRTKLLRFVSEYQFNPLLEVGTFSYPAIGLSP